MRPIFLEGKNIFLAPLSQGDDFQEYAFWLNNQKVTFFMGSGKFPVNIDSLKKYVNDYEDSNIGMLLGIFLKDSEKHIGNITLRQIEWKDRHGEVGIVIGDKEQWGKGYGTCAIRLVIEHAFNKLNLHKLCAGVIKGNEASKRAFEKVGFETEGVLKEHFYLNGKYHDCYRLRLLRDKYKL